MNPKTKGRMLNKDVSNSKKLAKLSPEACVLFFMIIPQLDSHGKMNGGIGYIKDEVCPRIPYLTMDNIPALLTEITEHTNTKWFEVDGRCYIHSTNFLTEHQTLDPKKLGRDLLPNYSGVSQEIVPHEEEVKDQEEVEGEGDIYPPTDGKWRYADHVMMTVVEHEKLCSRFGHDNARAMIDKLDAYKGSKGKKYKSDYHAILTWVADEVMKNPPAPTPKKKEVAL